MQDDRPLIEWPTLALILMTYALWWGALYLPVTLAIVATAVLAALHSSLSHEALHGHPTRSDWLNAALVFPALSVLVPYLRFKDTHLAHHEDNRLTDPYDDPESNFLDPAIWARLAFWQKAIFLLHNTLAGRILIGPILGQIRFMVADLRGIAQGHPRVLTGWLLHVPSVALVLWLVWISPMPLWAYGVTVYLANAILRIRTFLEHRAHDKPRGRSVIIEDRGLLAFLFLNNNLHAVHHCHPQVPWYNLPALYAQHRERYLRQNDEYRYASYGQIFRKYLWRSKDPVPHPLYNDWTSPRR